MYHVAAVVKLDTFFCGMHSFAHFADFSVAAGLEAEKAIVGGDGVPILNPQFKKA